MLTPARRAALGLALLSWACLIVSALVLALGPLSLPAIGLSISHVGRPLIGAVALAVAALATGRSARGLLLDLAGSRLPYVATFLLLLAVMTVLLASRGAVSVGGADSAGYLSQARLWQQRRVHAPVPLQIPGLPDTAWVQSPLGFRPDPTGTAIVPSYPPGLPWLEAAALTVGGEGLAVRGLPWFMSLVALAALFTLAARHADAAGAALAAVCLATLPAFLFQSLQPMSDVPALALWLLALALASHHHPAALAGAAVATAVAILVRPNLAPLALPVAWQAVQTPGAPGRALHRALPIALALLTAIGLVAAVQARLYGSPLQSGYGRASELFALSHVGPNLRLYPAWLVESTSTPGAALLIVGSLWLLVRSVRLPWVLPSLLMGAMTIAAYLVYVPFDSWTYLRFVLIALAVTTLGIAGALADAWHRRPGPWRFPVFAALVLLVGLPNLQQAQRLGVFGLRAREYRYEAAGRFVAEQMPDDTVLVAGQHSASASYYSGRDVLRADLLDAASFATVSRWAEREDRPLVFVLDASEAERLRPRLGSSGLAALDWPPRAEIGRPVSTRVWLSTDAERYQAGQLVPTRRIVSVP